MSLSVADSFSLKLGPMEPPVTVTRALPSAVTFAPIVVPVMVILRSSILVLSVTCFCLLNLTVGGFVD